MVPQREGNIAKDKAHALGELVVQNDKCAEGTRTWAPRDGRPLHGL